MKPPDLHLGLIALRDCGLIMASTWHPVFSQLVRDELVVRRPLPTPGGFKSVYRLGERGKRYVDRHSQGGIT